MLKHIGQDNDNGLLGLSFWTFIKKKSILKSFRIVKKNQISRQNVSAKMFPPNVFWNSSREMFFFKVPAKCFFKGKLGEIYSRWDFGQINTAR